MTIRVPHKESRTIHPIQQLSSARTLFLISAHREHEAKTADVCRKHRISSATFYKCKAKYGGHNVSDAKHLKPLEDENAALKKLLAEAMLDNTMLKESSRKMVTPAVRPGGVACHASSIANRMPLGERSGPSSHLVPRAFEFRGLNASSARKVLLQVMWAGVSGRFDLQGRADEGCLETYRSALRMIGDHPWFGTGLGTFVWSFPAYRSANVSMWGIYGIGRTARSLSWPLSLDRPARLGPIQAMTTNPANGKLVCVA